MKWFDDLIVKQAGNILSKNKQREENQYKVSAKEKYALGVSAGTSINLVGAQIGRGHDHTLESHPDLNFRMFRAENGYVMEVRQYDKRTDRHSINMHIIPDDVDLGSSIAHIITIESLKAK